MNIDIEVRDQKLKEILAGETTQAAVARELGCSRQAVSIWVKNAKAGIVTGKRGRPRQNKDFFSSKDRSRTMQKIRRHPPAFLNFGSDADLWTPELVQALIKSKTGIDHPLDQCVSILLDSRAQKTVTTVIHSPPAPTANKMEADSIITEKDLGPYLEKIEQARQMMKRTSAAPAKRSAPSPKNKKKRNS